MSEHFDRLYPSITDPRKRLDAEENVKRYVAWVLRVFERVRAQRTPPMLDELNSSSYDPKKTVDNPPDK